MAFSISKDNFEFLSDNLKGLSRSSYVFYLLFLLYDALSVLRFSLGGGGLPYKIDGCSSEMLN